MYTLTNYKTKKNGIFRFGSKVFTTTDGRHKANNVILREVAINKRVLRVHLDRINPLSEGETYLSRRGQSLRRSSIIAQKKIKSLDEISGIFEKISSTTTKRYKSDIINNNLLKSSVTNKMIRNKTETTNRSTVQVGNIGNSSGKMVRYKTTGSDTLNKSGDSKYIISGPVSSTPYMNHNFNPKIKNTYQVKRRSVVDTVRYCLEYLPQKAFEDRTLNYKFSKLAVDVRSLRLPAPHWKIKIYMRNKAISSIAFTNKQERERVLKFSAMNNSYEMIIDNQKADLLGSPLTVDGRQDVEILLDILHNISSDNPMIAYK